MITVIVRWLLFAACLVPIVLSGQRNEYAQAFERHVPPGLGEPFRLPSEPDNLTRDDRIKVVTRIHIIGSSEAYKKAFPRYIYTRDSLEKYKERKDEWYYRLLLEYHVDSLPPIDFDKKELVIFSGCGQCLAYCDINDGHNSCHRNVCMDMYKAFLRDRTISNEPAYQGISSFSMSQKTSRSIIRAPKLSR